MRLTLRTLLAYLDDTLEPAQAKVLGAKLQESEQARELVERIRQVLRKRKPAAAQGAAANSTLDANTLAEYLDNSVSPEKATEVEQICLASDVHLAEVAQCHQILTLLQAEPADVPEASRKRMIALVKGPEAVPHRKVPAALPKAEAEPPHDRDTDETLRLGLPLFTKEAVQRWSMIGGGAVAVLCLIVLAVVQIVNIPRDVESPPRREVAQTDPDAKGVEVAPVPILEKPDVKPPVVKVPDKKPPTDDGIPMLPPVVLSPDDPSGIKLPPVVIPSFPKDDTINPVVVPKVAFAAPSMKQVEVGRLMLLDAKEPGVLIQGNETHDLWKRIQGKKLEVKGGLPTVSLPGTRSTLITPRGIKLTLWGSLPETSAAPLRESSVVIHEHPELDLDLTLIRGRIVLVSVNPERATTARIRFENPTAPQQQEFWDITLHQQGSEVLIDRFSLFPRDEPFYKDPKTTERKGPIAIQACLASQAPSTLRVNDLTKKLPAGLGRLALLHWTSREGDVKGPEIIGKVPEWADPNLPLPRGPGERIAKDMLRARGFMEQSMTTGAVDVALAEMFKSPDPSIRRLAIRCAAACDDLATLLDLMSDDRPDVRQSTIEVLRDWIAQSRDNEYKLYARLQKKVSRANDADVIMSLLHSFSAEAAGRPETYEILINYLVHPTSLPIRELAAWHLYLLAPVGKDIAFDAADATIRERAHVAWRRLIPPNQLPSTVKK